MSDAMGVAAEMSDPELGSEFLTETPPAESGAVAKAPKAKKAGHERVGGLPKSGRIKIARENMKDLEFTGKLLVEVENYHGDSVKLKKSRWTRLSVYSVEGKEGLYVAVVTHLSFTGLPPVYYCKPFSKESEVEAFFGQSFLAKSLYEKMGFGISVEALN